MRQLVLLFGLILLLHPAARAQHAFSTETLEKFQPTMGHYALRDGRQGEGEITFEPAVTPRVTIRLSDGKKVKFRPDEVVSFTLGECLFMPTNELAEHPTEANAARYHGYFVQVLDTGHLVLVRQYKPLSKAGASSTALLIRHSTDGHWTEIPMPFRGAPSSQSFRETLAPFLAGRDDLLEDLHDSKLTYRLVPAYVEAYNSGHELRVEEE